MRFPTIPEMMTAVGCVLYGHDWYYGVCEHCGAEKEDW